MEIGVEPALGAFAYEPATSASPPPASSLHSSSLGNNSVVDINGKDVKSLILVDVEEHGDLN